MKRTLIMFLFVFSSLSLFAPNLPTTLYVEMPTPIIHYNSTFEPLIKAIRWFETRNHDLAYNKLEDAYGPFQIRRSSKRVEHFNLETGKNYTYEDMFDFQKSREVFLHYAKGKSYEQAAKDWNGSGIMTVVYWMNIKNIMNGVNAPLIICRSKKDAQQYLASLL